MFASYCLRVNNLQLVQRGRSNIVNGHLKGALTVMCTNPEPLDPTGVFLERVSLRCSLALALISPAFTRAHTIIGVSLL